jgi:hypothetical protein
VGVKLAVRAVRLVLALLLIAIGSGVLALKAWGSVTGPYLETLPPYPFCDHAADALAAGEVAEALELAEAGGCEAEATRARARWDAMGAVAARCWEGVWRGEGGDDAAAVCAIVSDLVVVGDLRDLARQGIGWSRGEETDTVLVALSAAGVALTFAPALSGGTATRIRLHYEASRRQLVAARRRRRWSQASHTPKRTSAMAWCATARVTGTK